MDDSSKLKPRHPTNNRKTRKIGLSLPLLREPYRLHAVREGIADDPLAPPPPQPVPTAADCRTERMRAWMMALAPLWMRAWRGLDARVRVGNAYVTDLAGITSGAKPSCLADIVVCESWVYLNLSKGE